MKTRALSFLLVLCMVFTLLPGAALAADEQQAQHVKLEAEGGHLILDAATGTIVKCEANVKSAVIPASVDLESEAEEGEEHVTYVVEIKAVGDKAFAGCTELTEVYFAGSPEIAENAFEGVTATVYYPIADKKLWKDKTTSYGGELTWDTWCPKHSVKSWFTDNAATCTETGLKHGMCSYCGEIVTQELPALGHKVTKYEVVEAATCTEAGIEIGVCRVCKAEVTKVIDALGHEFDSWKVTREPTCTEEGEQMRYCTRCDYIEGEAINPTGHKVDEWTETEEATCIAEGVETGECSVCNEKVTRAIPMKDHTYGEWTVVKEATCIEKGVKQRVCSVCEDVESGDVEALGHDWHKVGTSSDATCTKEGKLDHVCDRCGERETEVIPALGHTPADERVEAKAATCTEVGYTGDVVCSVCDEVIEKGEVIPALGHEFGEDAEWVTTTEPTCTTPGEETCTCTVCDETVTRAIPVTEHNIKNWTVLKNPTCTEEGRRVGYCSECKGFIAEAIAALGHTPADELVGAKAATCTEEGYTGDVVCSVCNEVIENGEIIAALGHTPADERADAKAATCTEEGYTGDVVCSVCGEVIEEGEIIAALGHTPADERADAKAATCTKEGYTGDVVCSVCGEVIEKGEAIAALGHEYKNGVCVNCGEKMPADPFKDISTSGYYNYIVEAANAGIIAGYPDGTYRPNNIVTRAQFITMLYRAAGSPEVKNAELKLDFDDAATIADSYVNAVAWGVENKIINGYEDNTFRPNQNISRAQMATFMYRYMKDVAGYDFGDVEPCKFADAAEIAAPYADAVNAIVSAGVMNGMNATTFAPNNTANRGMAATVILRVHNLMA